MAQRTSLKTASAGAMKPPNARPRDVSLPVAGNAQVSEIVAWLCEREYAFEMPVQSMRHMALTLQFDDGMQAQATAQRWGSFDVRN